MLIDARHREETRVAVVKGNRIEEFDFESAERKQLKGNIYLAKVTRVEPSLQAAFVEYGGNRHGFLAFSEIHPDYYQIPRRIATRCFVRRPSTPPRKRRCAPARMRKSAPRKRMAMPPIPKRARARRAMRPSRSRSTAMAARMRSRICDSAA
jgi:Rne/Rng family ribonuclease